MGGLSLSLWVLLPGLQKLRNAEFQLDWILADNCGNLKLSANISK